MISEDEYVASAVDMLTNASRLQVVRNKVHLVAFHRLSLPHEAKEFVTAVRIAHAARVLLNSLTSQRPPVEFISMDDCLRFVLNTRLPSSPDAPSPVVAQLVCEEWFHPLDMSAVNRFGGPLRRGKSVTLF